MDVTHHSTLHLGCIRDDEKLRCRPICLTQYFPVNFLNRTPYISLHHLKLIQFGWLHFGKYRLSNSVRPILIITVAKKIFKFLIIEQA